MDLYTWLKLFHVIFIVIWVGGDFSSLIYTWRAEAKNDGAAFMRYLPDILFFAKFVATPTSLGALACGIGMVLISWDFSQLWILIGLVGLLSAAVIGVAMLRPRSVRLLAAPSSAQSGIPVEAREVLRYARVEHLIVFLVIADMITKPTYSDLAVWGTLLGLFVVGIALIFRPGQSAAVAVPNR